MSESKNVMRPLAGAALVLLGLTSQARATYCGGPCHRYAPAPVVATSKPMPVATSSANRRIPVRGPRPIRRMPTSAVDWTDTYLSPTNRRNRQGRGY